LLRILYLVPSLADPAVARRVAMLRLGGAEVEIAGFRRADAPPDALPAGTVMEFDVTHDGRMLQRLFATLTAALRARGWARSFARPDVVIARNLEMLGIANRLLGFWPQPPALVYECLDLHRLMLREDHLGRSMRRVEQRLSRSAALLLTSSPAFLDNYFARHGSPPPYLVENKVFAPESAEVGDNPALRGDSAPIRIGWFGALRCRRSLKALDAASRALSGHVEVVLRGRPALTEFDDFHATIAAAPHVRYAGAYRYPDDLAEIYAGVHFAWAIDFFEAGQNSRWLLPNRLYEGCRNGAIPIAVAGTETAAFIERLGIGIVIPDIEPATLIELFSALTPERVLALAQAVRAQDASAFRCDTAECVALVDRLADLAPVALEAAA
jgi:hypothetical protein